MLVSIIIPVYKTEKYLHNCINSVISQTYTNIEILLVDDGSPDGCGKICDEYALSDTRIKVLHTDNHGLSDARNLGIDKCKGDYVTFLDSDDYIDNTFIETLVQLQKKHNADIVQCNRYYNNETKNEESEIETVYSNVDAQYLLYGKYYIPTVNATCKLINIKLFNSLRFESGIIHEDEFIIHRMLHKANKLVFINKRLYCVNRSTNSITRSKFSLKKLDIIYALEDRLKFYDELKLKKLYALTLYRYVGQISMGMRDVKKYSPFENVIIKQLRQKLVISLYNAILNTDLTIRNKISLLIKAFKRS